MSERFASEFIQGLKGEKRTAGQAYILFLNNHTTDEDEDLIAQSMKLFGNENVVVDIATNPNATFSD